MPRSNHRSNARKLPRGTLAHYRERIVEVLGEARGQRVMIRSVHSDGAERLTAVKLINLLPLDSQLF
jgi:CMP-2-keto-3-deoxyoctulosonic acid synthetase